MKKYNLYLLLFICLFAMCKRDAPLDNGPSTPAIYYWKTTMDFDSNAAVLGNRIGIEDVYLRYFDVDWSPGYNEAIPLGILETNYNDIHFYNKNVIPTVFITNRTFKRLNQKDLNDLADKITLKIDQITNDLDGNVGSAWVSTQAIEMYSDAYWRLRDSTENRFTNSIREIQIDCDWTESTKDIYFNFLKKIKQRIGNKTLSCTVRLHQYRDRETMGIPPTDRGMLMCYNVAKVSDHDTKNAIIDAQIVQQYLKGDAYPITLDVALPMFSWGAWYRDHEFQGLLSGWNEKKAADSGLYKSTSNHFYQVKVDTVLGRNYLREGDMIRLDGSFENEINETITLIKEEIALGGSRVAFFDWDFEKIKENENELQNYYNNFD